MDGETYERSVTWTKVSLKEAKIRATPKTSSPEDRGVVSKIASFSRVAVGARKLNARRHSRMESGHNSPSRTWGPKEMFSWAGRTVLDLGGIVTAVFGELSFGGG